MSLSYQGRTCRRMVSGSFSLLCPRCFSPFPHGTRSLSVSREYLALPDGPGGFDQDFTCPGLLRMPLGISAPRVRGCHPVPPPFPGAFRFAGCFHLAVLLPRDCRNSPGLGYSPVARRYWGNHCCFLLLRVLRCFSSPRSPPIKGWHAFSVPGCPIRKSAHQRPFAPPRGLSQLVTSFVASGSQGIHRAPLLAYVCIILLIYRSISRLLCQHAPPLLPEGGRHVPLVVVSLSSMSKNGAR